MGNQINQAPIQEPVQNQVPPLEIPTGIANTPLIQPVTSQPVLSELPVTKSKLIPVLLIILAFAILGTGGYFVYQRYFAKEPVATRSPSPTPQVTADPTADWKKYVSQNKNLEFQYPKNWTVITDQSSYISVGENSKITNHVDDNVTVITNTNKTLEEMKRYAVDYYMGSTAGLADEEPKIIFQDNITFNGKPAYKFVYELTKPYDSRSNSVTEILVPDSGFIIDMRFRIPDKNLLNQILSTFKFTNQNQDLDFDSLNSAAKSALISRLGRTPTTEYGVSQQDTKTSDNWAFGIITIYATGEGGPDLYHFLGKKVDSKWQVEIEVSQTFKEWVSETPEGLINPELKKIWVSN